MLAFEQRFADILAGDEDRLLVFVAVHQVHAADRIVVRGKTDFDRLDLQIALQLAEYFLGVEIAPDGRAVVVRGVGMLAADDDVGEAEVLTIDRSA